MAKKIDDIIKELNDANLIINRNSSIEDIIDALSTYGTVSENELDCIKFVSVKKLPNTVVGKADEVKSRMYGIVTDETNGSVSVMNKRFVLTYLLAFIIKGKLDKINENLNDLNDDNATNKTDISDLKNTVDNAVKELKDKDQSFEIDIEEIQKYIEDNKEFIKKIPGKIDIESIADNLFTDDNKKVLSAKQGRILKVYVDEARSLANGNNASIKQLQDGMKSKVDVSSIVDNLSSEAVDKPLSAKQGKLLKGLIDGINNQSCGCEEEITNLKQRLDTLLDSDDTTLDQLSEIVAYIKGNKDLIDAITDSKVSTSVETGRKYANISNNGVNIELTIGNINGTSCVSYIFNDDGTVTVEKYVNDELDSSDTLLTQKLYKSMSYVIGTYNSIKQLKDSNQLIPNTLYVISDYVATTITPDTMAVPYSSQRRLQISVKAITPNSFCTEACIEGVGISMFSGAKDWTIKYSFDNNTELYDWADSINGKGVIFYMKDEFGNEAPYDFKNILFKRYKITSVEYDYNNEFIGKYYGFAGCSFATYDYEDYRWCYTFQNEDTDIPSDAVLDGFPVVNNVIDIYHSGENFKKQSLNNIVFYASNDIVEYYGNSYSAREIKDNYFMGESHHMTLGADCTQNILGYCSRYNIIGRVFNHNNIGSDFEYCMIGSYARFNVIGEDFEYCVAGEYMMQNDIGTACFRNIFGDHFRMNKMSATSGYNVFGSNCKSNVLIANCCYNIIGNNVLGCTFGNDARYSKIGDNICYSSIGAGARYVGLSNSSGDIKCNYHIMDNQQFEENNPKYYEVTENSNVRIELYFDGVWKIKGEPISQTATLDQITSQITAQAGTSVIGTINGNSRATNNLLALNDGTSQKSSVTIAIKDGVVTTSGTPSNNGWIKIEEVKVPAGTYYYKDFGQSNTKLSLVNSSYQMQSFPTTYSSDTTLYLVINGSTINSTGNVTNAMPMLVKGSTAPSKFEPYFSGIKSATPTSITSVGKNLCDFKPLTVNSNEWQTMVVYKAYVGKGNNVSCRVSFIDHRSSGGNGGIGLLESDNPNLTYSGDWSSVYFDLFAKSEYGDTIDLNHTSNSDYIYVMVGANGNAGAFTINDVMINYGANALPYEPYQAESLKLKGSVIKRVGKVIYTGTEGWTDWEGAKGVELPSNMRGNSLQAWEDVPEVEMLNNLGVNKISPYRLASGERGISIGNNNWRRLLIDSTTFASISPSNPLVLLYELATPQAQEYDGNAMSTMTITSVGGYMGRQVFQGTITLPDCNATNTSSSAYNGIISNYGDVLKCDDLYNLNGTALGVYNNNGVRTLVVTVKDITSNEALNEYLSAHPLVVTYANTNSNNTDLCLELASAGSVSDELVIPNNTLAVANGGSIIQEGTDTPAKVEITYSLNLVQEVLNNAERDKDQEARIKQLEEQVKSLLQSIQ